MYSPLGPNPNEPEPNRLLVQKSLHKKQEFHWLGPNPDEPEPNKASLQIFLPDVQEIYWLGPKYVTLGLLFGFPKKLNLCPC